MKKSKLVNIVMIIMIVFSILFATKETLAANNGLDIKELTLNNTTAGGNNATNNAAVNNNVVNNTVSNNNVLTTNNTSNYNNSALPKTGIVDSFPSVILLVVFGISAIYAYKKIQDYKNI